MNGLKHIAPFLEEDFIKLVLSIDGEFAFFSKPVLKRWRWDNDGSVLCRPLEEPKSS